MKISGRVDFVSKTEEALKLLKEAPKFGEVSQFINLIKEHERSGMNHWAKSGPTYEVGYRTWSSDLIWYASCIAHDAYHSKLYEENKVKNGQEPSPETYSGIDAEVKCCIFQRAVLIDLGASEYWIKEIDNHIKHPEYSLIPYDKRDW